VELGGAGGPVPGAGLGRLRRVVLQLLPAGPPQLQAQEVRARFLLRYSFLGNHFLQTGITFPRRYLDLGAWGCGVGG